MNEIKLCKDCKHFTDKNFWVSCKNPKLGTSDITGLVVAEPCKEVRSWVMTEYCGREGNWFEKKLTLSEKIKVWFMKEVK